MFGLQLKAKMVLYLGMFSLVVIIIYKWSSREGMLHLHKQVTLRCHQLSLLHNSWKWSHFFQGRIMALFMLKCIKHTCDEILEYLEPWNSYWTTIYEGKHKVLYCIEFHVSNDALKFSYIKDCNHWWSHLIWILNVDNLTLKWKL